MAHRRHFKNLHRALLWVRRHKRRVKGVTVVSNAPIAPQPHVALTFQQKVVAYCHTALQYAGQMVYTETSLRSQLFHRSPGDFKGAHADCSQFVSSILHWLGSHKATDTDWTGTMLTKYPHAPGPGAGRAVVFGKAPGVHVGVLTEKAGTDWYVVAFGHQGAPDRNTLSGLKAYFAGRGHPGVTYLDLS